jgi:N-sulfoglucosamine sulfohydrolase
MNSHLLQRCLTPALLAALWLALPISSSAAPPNILFAIADDWGAHAGAYGHQWVKTPNFDRVAKDGILFTRAFTPNAKCAPSRAAILTGRNSWQLEEAANHICYFPPKFKGWGEALAENGWTVGYTTKGWGPGVATNTLGQARQMTGKAFNTRKLKPETTGILATDYAANFADFLDTTSKDKPWAFWYGAVEPHRGYEFGSGVAKGGKKLTDLDRVPAYWPDNETVRNDILDYAFEVEHFDRHLGRMLAELEKRGLLDHTLVIVTADHGWPFPRGKGSAYEASNHVPFAAMWPRGIQKPGRTVDDYISFIDLAPTFIELAGLTWKQTGLAESPGRSLTDIFRSEKSGRVNPARDHVLIGMERHDIGRPGDVGYPIRGIIKDDALYLRNYEPARWPACNPETGYLNVDASPTKSFILDARRASPGDQPWALCFGKRPAEELYDLKSDPDAVKNLAAMPAHDRRREQLRREMEQKLKAQGDPRMEGRGHVFDQYLHANPQHVNFYERYMKGEKLKAGWVKETDFEKAPLD